MHQMHQDAAGPTGATSSNSRKTHTTTAAPRGRPGEHRRRLAPHTEPPRPALAGPGWIVGAGPGRMVGATVQVLGRIQRGRPVFFDAYAEQCKHCKGLVVPVTGPRQRPPPASARARLGMFGLPNKAQQGVTDASGRNSRRLVVRIACATRRDRRKAATSRDSRKTRTATAAPGGRPCEHGRARREPVRPAPAGPGRAGPDRAGWWLQVRGRIPQGFLGPRISLPAPPRRCLRHRTAACAAVPLPATQGRSAARDRPLALFPSFFLKRRGRRRRRRRRRLGAREYARIRARQVRITDARPYYLVGEQTGRSR